MCSRKNRISEFGGSCGKSSIRNQAGDGPGSGTEVHRERAVGKDKTQMEEHKEFSLFRGDVQPCSEPFLL